VDVAVAVSVSNWEQKLKGSIWGRQKAEDKITEDV
jgi:hypothetical protein